MIEEA